jgi:hypothetical protein
VLGRGTWVPEFASVSYFRTLVDLLFSSDQAVSGSGMYGCVNNSGTG